MKNLKLSSQRSAQLDLKFEEEALLLSAFDIEHNRIFFASSANIIYTLQFPLSQHLYQNEAPWSKALLSSEAQPIDLEPGDSIVAMDYLIEKEALMVGTSNGCLVLHTVDSRMTELIGRVEGGVKSVASSPDGALFAVTTGSGQLLVMTHDWEVLYETVLDPQLSDNVIIADTDSSPSNGYQSSISWRGDGKYFATLGGIRDSSSLQKLRVWERESGMLHSASDSKTFMGKSLDWMPSGAKLAAVYDRRAENKCPLIAFFEKNGLERNSFAIDEPSKMTIELLKWNCNSDLLAASVTCDQYDAIKIWSFSNYHWYLKQEIRYSKKDGVKFTWDPTKPLHLICWTLGGMIMSYNFVWITAVTETTTALVIDNSNVLVTPLAFSLMPPPMALFNLKFHSAVQDIAFLSKSSKNYMAAYLSDSSLCAVELPAMDLWDQFESKEFEIEKCLSDFKLGSFMHLSWLDSHILLGVSCCQTNNCLTSLREDMLAPQQQKHANSYYLQEIELVCSEDSVPGLLCSSSWHAKISNTLPLEGPIIGIVPHPAKRSSAFVQMNGGSVFEYASNMSIMRVSAGSHFHEFNSAFGFASSCPWMKAVVVHDNGTTRPLLFGLDDSGRLHVGRRVLCNSCSSFSFYSSTNGVTEVVTHLILTTKQDLLFIISIDDVLHGDPEVNFESYSSSKNQGKDNKEYVNIWEKGAKLLGVIHGDEAAVILQTNRGNLECIYPRKLVLVSILNALVQGRFRDAMLMVRRHRIDFNVIVDYCGWKTFIKSVAEFVSQVKNLGHITDFVCSIKNENVINTLYKPYISLPSLNEKSTGQSDGSQGFGAESKIFSVLLAVRRALEERLPESPARELCILTTLARSEPPALEEALNRVKVIRQLELSGVDDARPRSYPSAEESLKHLLWLTDPEAVYEAALGLYDLNLSAIVALNSQKDPKEFLPFLKGLENLPPAVMRYTIDLRLRRHESALRHIVAAGDAYHEDCMNLLKNNPVLFPLGLQLFNDDIKRKQVQEAWGDHLHAEKCFADAAMTYLCCSSYQKALMAYRACGDWRGLFTVAGLLKLGKGEILHLASELCEEFLALGNPAEAAKIALEYCADVAKGVGYFIMAREWDEALRIAYMNERDDLIADVKDAALECATTLISEYKEAVEKVGKYLARYLAVRQRRIVLAARIQSEDRLNDADYDTVSEVSSGVSEMSAYTTRTGKDSVASTSISTASKSRDTRRQRHKGGKIRAGSPGEEMALVDHLKGMSLTPSAQRELKSLLKALVMLGKEEIAQQMQSVGDNFQLAQLAAVKLAEDTMTNEIIDDNTHTLEHYMKKLKALSHSQALCWQSKVLVPPLQGH